MPCIYEACVRFWHCKKSCFVKIRVSIGIQGRLTYSEHIKVCKAPLSLLGKKRWRIKVIKALLLHRKVKIHEKKIWEHLSLRVISKGPMTYLLININMAFKHLAFQSANFEKKKLECGFWNRFILINLKWVSISLQILKRQKRVGLFSEEFFYKWHIAVNNEQELNTKTVLVSWLH